MATDLTWRVRRAAARWMFLGRRMDLVGEEVTIHTAEITVPDISGKPYRRPDGVRSIDVLGLTRSEAREGWATKRQEIRAIEVKVSRGDLLAGIRKGQVGNDPARGGIGAVVDFAHLLVWGDVRIEFGEVPDRWGLLIAREQQLGSRDGQPRSVISIEVARPAKRLTPAFALDVDRLERVIVQSSLWRLYDVEHELSVRRWPLDAERPREVAVG